MKQLSVIVALLSFSLVVGCDSGSPPSMMMDCGNDSDACAVDDDCCSGLCVDSACLGNACVDDGQACAGDADCCTGVCIDSLCSPAPACVDDGLDCGADAECCSGTCGADGLCGADVSCFACACETDSWDGGCRDVCDSTFNGTGIPDFCQGASARTACEQCILEWCGSDSYNCY